ncbi:MAG: PilZ domain-containing protein [SAR324 cluster bacterium]
MLRRPLYETISIYMTLTPCINLLINEITFLAGSCQRPTQSCLGADTTGIVVARKCTGKCKGLAFEQGFVPSHKRVPDARRRWSRPALCRKPFQFPVCTTQGATNPHGLMGQNLETKRHEDEDARRNPRFTFHGALHVRDCKGTKLRALDLSLGGIGIDSDGALGIGRTLEVVLLDGSVRVEGVVRYEVRTAGLGWRIGVQFLRPQPELVAVAVSIHTAVK